MLNFMVLFFCPPQVDCGDHNGMGRRKRQTDQNTNVDIVKGVEVYEPGSGMSDNKRFVIVYCTLLLGTISPCTTRVVTILSGS